MKLIIDIDEQDYERFKKDYNRDYDGSMLKTGVIANGTPIPDNEKQDDAISALERQAELQGNLVSRKAVINTLESMYNACDNNCYDLYLLLKESYEVLPSAYSDIEAIRREIDGLLNNYDNRMYDLGVIETLEIIDKHMKGDIE